MSTTFLGSLALVAAGASAAPGGDPPATRDEVVRVAHLMGTRATVQVSTTDAGGALPLSERVLTSLEATEALLSTWKDTSPLALANRAAVGEGYPLPEPLRRLLQEALEWSERTGGAFDPRVGALVDAWDLRGSGRVPDALTLENALEATGSRGMTLGTEGLVRLHPSAWLDAGGFGKGAALRTALARLPESASARVDLGGQVAVRGAGDAPDGAWTVEVAHPRLRFEPVLRLRVRDGSVATSGNAQRGLTVDGVRVGHILDPRTGRPAPDRGSVTVVAEDPLVADLLATALYVLGPDEGLAWAQASDDVGVLFLAEGSEGLVLRCNEAMRRWLEPTADTVRSSCILP